MEKSILKFQVMSRIIKLIYRHSHSRSIQVEFRDVFGAKVQKDKTIKNGNNKNAYIESIKYIYLNPCIYIHKLAKLFRKKSR